MDINQLTIGEAKQLAQLLTINKEQSVCPFQIGQAYFIRTVTYHLTGRVQAIVGGFLVLTDAAWIADSGRYGDAMKKGILNEVEPLPDGTLVAIGSITDASPWNHPLPKDQK